MYFRGSSPSAHRIAAYEAKVRAYTGTGTAPDYTAPVVQFKLTQMYQGFQGACDDQLDYTGRALALVASLGVKTIQFPFFMAFCGKLYGLSRRVTGESLRVAAKDIVDLWVARGLDQTTLDLVRTSVFSIADPAA